MNVDNLKDDDDVIDATTYPEFCIQGGALLSAGGAGSEDCLKVNVYKPENATSESKCMERIFN